MEQEQSALVPSNYNNLPREAKKTKDSIFDRIYKYYHNDNTRIELSPEEIRIRERWEKAWLLLCRHRTRKQVVELLEKLFNVEKSVAYDDVKKAMMLFSDPNENLKSGKRSIMETQLQAGADKAWKSGNLDLHLKYIKEIIALNKLDEGGEMGIEEIMKKLKTNQIIIVANTDELEAEARALQQELASDIADIEHEEVKDGESED